MASAAISQHYYFYSFLNERGLSPTTTKRLGKLTGLTSASKYKERKLGAKCPHRTGRKNFNYLS